MSQYIETPDGVAEFPDDMSAEDIAAVLKQQYAPQEPPSRTLSERVFRNLGLGVRYLTETPGLTVAGLADLGSQGVNAALGAAGADYRLPTNRAETVRGGFTRMGFPEPNQADPYERYGERVSRAGVGAMMGPAVGARLAGSSNPVTAGVGTTLRESPAIQATGAGSGAIVGQTAAELGAGPKTQMAAEFAGGMLASPMAAATTRTVAGAGRAALGVKDTLTRSGQRRIVGNILDDSALNSSRASQNISDEVAGTGGIRPKTTGEASRDPGLLTIERAMRATDSQGRFSQRLSEANLARQKILDVLGGGDVKAARAARDEVTGAQRDAAFSGATEAKPDGILRRIDTILASPAGKRKVVRNALNEFRDEFEGVTDPRVLYEIRKDINEAMQGKLGGDKSSYRLARSELKAVKSALDDAIEDSAPGFKKYLEDYAKLSQDIDRREIIQGIQERSRLAAPDPSTGRDILSQAKFRRLVDAEEAAGTLTEEQIKVLRAIADDLDSGQAINAATVRPPGSDTARNLTVAHVLGRAIGGNTDSPLLQNLARPLRWVTQLAEDDIQGLLADAMLDPALAKQLLAEARPDQIRRTVTALRSIAARSGAGATLGALPPDPESAQEQ